MNYGLYVSASGMMTNIYRQGVYANNLANVATAAFKPDVPVLKQRDAEAIEDHLGMDVSKKMLDQLGGGVLVGPGHTDFTPGPLTHTGNPLDVALTQSDAFFAVQYKPGANSPPQVGLTRDGRLMRNGQGQLVTAAGNPVLDENDRPIEVPAAGPVTINATGQVIQQGRAIAQLQIVKVADTSTLEKRGNEIFAMTGAIDPRQKVTHPGLRVGYTEGSGVDPIKALMNLMAATRAVTGNANMIKYENQLMGEAINQLGKVA